MNEAASPFLDVLNLRKEFGGLVAVDDVSFSVKQGEIFGIIGPNGAGKTTVFNVLTGMSPATAGSATYRGRGILTLQPHAIAALGIGRTFQNIRLFTNMSILDNVLIGQHCRLESGFIRSMLRTRLEREEEMGAVGHALDLLARFGLADRWNMPAGILPYGEQRLLELARALATGATLVFLDEPASGMNSAETNRLMHFVEDIRKEGVTPVLIEHDMKVVMGICDRIIVLDEGRLIAEGPPSEVRQDLRVIEAYLGKEADLSA